MAKVLIISGVWTFLECAMLALTNVIYSQSFDMLPAITIGQMLRFPSRLSDRPPLSTKGNVMTLELNHKPIVAGANGHLLSTDGELSWVVVVTRAALEAVTYQPEVTSNLLTKHSGIFSPSPTSVSLVTCSAATAFG